MYKRIDFSKLEGLATYQDTLDFLQTSYREAISAVAKAFGSRVIVTGVTDLGTSYSDGWVVIDGELMPFAGGLKSGRIVVEEIADTELFNDGSIQTVYYTRRAKLGITGGYAFSDFVRIDTMTAITQSLGNLSQGIGNLNQGLSNLNQSLSNLVNAHNNLQTAFNNRTYSWSEITGKPPYAILRTGSFYFGDVPGDRYIKVNFPSVGSPNYVVAGSLESVSDWQYYSKDNDAFWMIKEKRADYFYLVLQDIGSHQNDLRFDYALISL
jgi:hypothetical protein